MICQLCAYHLINLETGSDFDAALRLSHNVKDTLSKIKYKERYSGGSNAVLQSVVGASGTVADIAKQLEVGQEKLPNVCMQNEKKMIFSQMDPKRLRKARKMVVQAQAAPKYVPLVHRVHIRRSKVKAEVKKEVQQWILDHTRPSSNSSRMKKWKDDDGAVQSHVVQWRDHTLAELFHAYQVELTDGEKVNKTLFYKLIPKYVFRTKLKEGLCPYHMHAHHLGYEMGRLRGKWHGNACSCACVYCSSVGCAHGKSPEDGKCDLHTCSRCKHNRCPVDWREDMETVWYTQKIEHRQGGGMLTVNEPQPGTRTEFMQFVQTELEQFQVHDELTEWVAQQVRTLKNNLRQKHVFIKGDFIQNIVHRRGAESSSSYYNHRQSQLLVFVIWYHGRASTKEKPQIKMRYVDYVSGFLKHSSLFFQKCFTHLNTWLTKKIPYPIKRVCTTPFMHYLFLMSLQIYLCTDGGKAHFKCRFSFYYLSTLQQAFGMCTLFCGL